MKRRAIAAPSAQPTRVRVVVDLDQEDARRIEALRSTSSFRPSRTAVLRALIARGLAGGVSL